MSLTLYYHPLSSFCHKALIALYENDTPFTPHLVDLSKADATAAFKAIWPIGKFPVLRDDVTGQTVPESTIIIEYLDQNYPGDTRFLPEDPDQALATRLRDRVIDLSLHEPMQKVVGDRIRPEGKKDPFGVEQARGQMTTTLSLLDRELAGKTWMMGEAFTLADCAAAPALFYANKVMPFGDAYRNVSRYFERLQQRPSYARVLKEAQPYMAMFPQ
jgi:glutathione S-transferase